MKEDAPLQVIELNFSSLGEGEEAKLGNTSVVWKDILPEGKFPMLPGQGARKVPFEVTPEGESSLVDRRISMSDLIDSFDRQAFPSGVTIPDGHPKMDVDGNVIDSALNNTGYVRALRVVKKGSKHMMQAALGFTEPDAAGKVKRGTVPNVSAGILFNWLRKDNQTRFRTALNHVALTKTPWMNLQPFQKVFASDEYLAGQETEIVLASFADDTSDNSGDNSGADIVWNEKDGSNWIREALSASLNPPQPIEEGVPYQPRPDYYVEDVSPGKKLGLVTEWFKGEKTRWVVPYTTNDSNEVSPAPAIRWVQGKEALIAASDDNNGDRLEFAEATPDKIIEKLSVSLSDMMGGDDFKIEAVALDNRCTIRNTKSGQGFEADFKRLVNGRVMLADAADWERTDRVTLNASTTQPVPAPSPVVPKFDTSTVEGRLAAARQRRRQMFAGMSY